jgi:hypothetical protein
MRPAICRRDTPGRSDVRSAFLGHPGRSSIGGSACGPVPRAVENANRAFLTSSLDGAENAPLHKNGPTGPLAFTNDGPRRKMTRPFTTGRPTQPQRRPLRKSPPVSAATRNGRLSSVDQWPVLSCPPRVSQFREPRGIGRVPLERPVHPRNAALYRPHAQDFRPPRPALPHDTLPLVETPIATAVPGFSPTQDCVAARARHESLTR